jgi:hypothetical protein
MFNRNEREALTVDCFAFGTGKASEARRILEREAGSFVSPYNLLARIVLDPAAL